MGTVRVLLSKCHFMGLEPSNWTTARTFRMVRDQREDV
jgi:hypothetical protein